MSLPAAGTQEAGAIRPCRKFEGHTEGVSGIIHLPDRRRIMTCSSDGSLRVWNSQNGKQIGNDWRDEESEVKAIALSPDGKKVVSGSEDGVVKVWDIDTAKVIAKCQMGDPVECVCWSRDGRRVVSGAEGNARVWDVESGKIVLAIETELKPVCAVIYSPDETMIATSGGGNKVRSDLFARIKIWDATTGKLVTNLNGHKWAVTCLTWTADGSTLISGSLAFDDSIITWNTTTWQQIHVFQLTTDLSLDVHDNRDLSVNDIAISPNGRILAIACRDNTARLWNLENSQPIGSPQVLQHSGQVNCVSFWTDGNLLATGCSDNNAYSWDMSVIEAALLNLNDGDKPLLDADATRRPDQRRENAHRLPPGFLDDSPRHPLPSRRRPLSPARPDTRPRPHFLEWARNTFLSSHRRQNDAGIELQERRPAALDVPFAKGKRRNVSGAEVRFEKEKARNAMNAKNAKNATASSSRPQQSSVTQQSSISAQAHPSSEPVLTSSNTVGAAATSTITTSRPDAIIPRAGRWSRFWLFICCTPVQYTDS